MNQTGTNGDEKCVENVENVENTAVTQQSVDEFIAEIKSVKMGHKTTVVCATLVNGFEVIGHSGCVDSANYDHVIGTEIAIKMIKNEIWKLLGFDLQNKLASGKETDDEICTMEDTAA